MIQGWGIWNIRPLESLNIPKNPLLSLQTNYFTVKIIIFRLP